MKAKKIIFSALCVLLALAAVIAPVVLLIGETAELEPQYSKTFYGALDDKYERLMSIEEDKIVVVGGSSVAFGLDSALLEKYTGMPVVNFGLYADIGTKFMLDLSRDGIKEGDVVMIAPELDRQTLSLYFDGDSTLKACDDDLSMLTGVRGADNGFAVLGALWDFNRSKLEFAENGPPDPVGIYNSANFNEYGDIDPEKFPRENNVLRTYYEMDAAKLVELDPSIVSEDFVEYLNEYIAYCKGKGATVYFLWCPVNDLALTENSDVKEFESFMKKSIECEFLGGLGSAVIDSHYFYDTNFHLNDAGVTLRTLNILTDLLIDWEKTVWFDETVPEPPEYKYNVVYDGPEDENARFFTYHQEANGAYTITGLSEEGKAQTVLTLPLGYDGFCVTAIDTNIFEGALCTKIVIPADTNIASMMGNFEGGSGITELWIYKFDEGEISPPGSFGGTGAGFKIHVPVGSNYKTGGYNWADSFGSLIVEDISE